MAGSPDGETEDNNIQLSITAEPDTFSDDDEFGEFGECESPKKNGDLVNNNNVALPTTTTTIENRSLNSSAEGPQPLKSTDIRHLSTVEIRKVLLPLTEYMDSEDDNLGDGTTPTSHQLWQHLTEPAWMPIPKWEGSPMHKQLALHLGVPLNLDESLPKTNTRKMTLPIVTKREITAGSEEAELMAQLPSWSLLSDVSPLALQSMSLDELKAHISHLEKVLQDANHLKDAMESREMDLAGEKSILEGMVESLLVFSQRNQREQLKNRTSKNKR